MFQEIYNQQFHDKCQVAIRYFQKQKYMYVQNVFHF